MSTVRIGIVGTGWVSQVFHLPILQQMNDVEIVGVCDKDRSRARMIAERFGIRRYFSNAEEMLKIDDMDAVDICTSTDAHMPMSLMAMESGRHVFVEKPVGRTISEAQQMAEAARKHKRHLMVGMNHRFRPDAIILKKFLQEGEIGKIFYIKTGWFKKLASNRPWITRKDKSGGGVVLDLGIVMLDLVLWMTEFPPADRVSARLFHDTTRSVEDSCIAVVHTKEGCSIFCEVSWSFRSEEEFYYCDFFGADGSARINPLRIHKELHGNLLNLTPARAESPQNLHRKSYENELAHFVNAVRGTTELQSTAEEAVQRMKIVDAIYKAAARSKEVAVT